MEAEVDFWRYSLFILSLFGEKIYFGSIRFDKFVFVYWPKCKQVSILVQIMDLQTHQLILVLLKILFVFFNFDVFSSTVSIRDELIHKHQLAKNTEKGSLGQ